MSMREETDVGLELALCEGIFRPAVKIPQRNVFFFLPLDAAFASLFYFKALTGLFMYIPMFSSAQGQHIFLVYRLCEFNVLECER